MNFPWLFLDCLAPCQLRHQYRFDVNDRVGWELQGGCPGLAQLSQHHHYCGRSRDESCNGLELYCFRREKVVGRGGEWEERLGHKRLNDLMKTIQNNSKTKRMIRNSLIKSVSLVERIFRLFFIIHSNILLLNNSTSFNLPHRHPLFHSIPQVRVAAMHWWSRGVMNLKLFFLKGLGDWRVWFWRLFID